MFSCISCSNSCPANENEKAVEDEENNNSRSFDCDDLIKPCLLFDTGDDTQSSDPTI